MNGVIARTVAGILLVGFGRKLFWFFVGVVGFLAGSMLAAKFFHAQPESVRFLIAAAAGVAGALLAVFLQRLAVGVAGFLAGGYVAMHLLSLLSRAEASWALPAFILGGTLGALLSAILFDWALILLSTTTGAAMIVQELHVSASASVILFLVLLVAGLMIQAGLLRRQAARSPSKK